MAERTRVGEQQQSRAIEQPSMADLIDRLSRFEGPPDAFLVNLLAVQCYLAAAGGGTILRTSQDGKVEVLAVYPQLPPNTQAPPWLAQAVEQAPIALSSGTTIIRAMRSSEDLYGAPPRLHLIMVPIRGGSSIRGAACFLVETSDGATLATCRERLELTVSLLSLYEMRLTLQRRQMDLSRLRTSMDVLGAINEHDRFAGAGMALCNELASRLKAERVSVGFLKGQYVHLKAQSHTEKFTRKMKVVQDIEAAMEECLDQDVEIIYPTSPEATYVSRSTKELSTRHGPSAIVSLPIRHGGEVKAVLTVERVVDRPYTVEEIEMLRLACDLAAARLLNLHEHDRWFGARALAASRKGLAVLVGPKHTWPKVIGILVSALIIFSIFAKGDYTADAKFMMEPTRQQAKAAPFDGFLESVYALPGDRVTVAKANRGGWEDKTAYAVGDEVQYGDTYYGCIAAHTGPGDGSTTPGRKSSNWALTVLAKLETKELEKNRDEAEVNLSEAEAQYRIDMEQSASDPLKLAATQLDMLKMRAAKLQMDEMDSLIKEAYLRAPMDGMVISGEDWTKHIRRPVKKGDVLYEIASPEGLRAVLEVPEDEMVEVKEGFSGQLATAAYPEKRVGFEVDLIYPVAEVVDQENVFRVRVKLDQNSLRELPNKGEWMRPGFKGHARITLDQRPYSQLWTQKLINWVRMKLWI